MDYVKYIKYLHYFHRLQKMTREELLKEREKNFKEILLYAFNHSSFYQESYKNAGITEANIQDVSLKDLPATNKKILMENFDSVVTDSRLKYKDVKCQLDQNFHKRYVHLDKYEILYTSGTTGQTGIFPVESNNLSIVIAAINSFLFSPIQFFFEYGYRCRYVNCVAIGPKAGTVISSYASNRLFVDKHIISVFDPVRNNIEKLNKIQPDIISGYSSTIKQFALEQLSGNLHITPKAIVCSGDAVDEEIKDLIYKAFGVFPKDYYSATENLFIGYRSNKEYFSLVDPICRLEENTISNLYNKIFPIIKYETEDIIDVIEDYSESPFTKIKLHTARSTNQFLFHNNVGILKPLSFFMFCGLYIKGAHAFQFSKQNDHTILAKIEGDQLFEAEKAKADFLQILKIQGFDRSVQIKIEVVDKIPIDTKTGKFKMVV